MFILKNLYVNYSTIKRFFMGSNKAFGILFSFIFLIIFIYNFYFFHTMNIFLLICSIIFLILGLINSRILSPFNYVWIKLGLILGKIISPLVLTFIYFVVFFPIGMLLKLFGKDVLNLKDNKKTSWINRKNKINSMDYQF